MSTSYENIILLFFGVFIEVGLYVSIAVLILNLKYLLQKLPTLDAVRITIKGKPEFISLTAQELKRHLASGAIDETDLAKWRDSDGWISISQAPFFVNGEVIEEPVYCKDARRAICYALFPPCCLAAIYCGEKALARMRGNPFQTGRVMAILSLMLGYAFLFYSMAAYLVFLQVLKPVAESVP